MMCSPDQQIFRATIDKMQAPPVAVGNLGNARYGNLIIPDGPPALDAVKAAAETVVDAASAAASAPAAVESSSTGAQIEIAQIAAQGATNAAQIAADGNVKMATIAAQGATEAATIAAQGAADVAHTNAEAVIVVAVVGAVTMVVIMVDKDHPIWTKAKQLTPPLLWSKDGNAKSLYSSSPTSWSQASLPGASPRERGKLDQAPTSFCDLDDFSENIQQGNSSHFAPFGPPNENVNASGSEDPERLGTGLG